MINPFAHLHNRQPEIAPDEPPPNEGALLPPAFQFSQQSLQDYVDCARRFQLAYVENRRWPAAESEPVEEQEHFMEQGAQFHLLVQRYMSGVPEEDLAPVDPLLARWWEAFLNHPPDELQAPQLLVEIALSVPLGGHRLTARFDLLALTPGDHITIIDWKTSRTRPSRKRMAQRMQTKVYPYIVTQAADHLFGGSVRPDQVSMLYWFSEDPTTPERFAYSASQHEENRQTLTGLMEEIAQQTADVWPLTENEWHCKFCVYRSLCDRGIQAGSLSEAEEEDPTLDAGEPSLNIDLDDIDEIAF